MLTRLDDDRCREKAPGMTVLNSGALSELAFKEVWRSVTRSGPQGYLTGSKDRIGAVRTESVPRYRSQ